MKWIREFLQADERVQLEKNEEMMEVQYSNIDEKSKQVRNAMMKKLDHKMEQQLLSNFASLRTSEMFEIFSEFPDSSPCLNDLKYALDQTKLHNLLAN